MSTESIFKTAGLLNSGRSISKQDKEAVGMLSIGTFLEYFDLKLYIHMAVTLNALFFPPSDPKTASLLAAFAFCSSFLFRPLGGLLFGYIGDKIGRKNTIFFTTFFMGAACFGMYKLPEYSEIGIWASIIMLLLRAIQGMSSLGEVIGAKLYLAETLRKPIVYPMMVIISLGAMAGGSFAIFMSKFILDQTGNWRYIFLAGSFIAFGGLVFRYRLRESNEFADANKRLPEDQKIDELLDKRLALSYFFMRCLYPFSLYLSFAYMPVILKQKYGYSISEILSQNLIVTLVDWGFGFCLVFISYKIFPFKILRFLSSLYIPLLIIMIPILQFNMNPTMIFIFQLTTMCLCPNIVPAEPIIYKSFPVFKRFKVAGIGFGLADALMYLISAFGTALIVNATNLIGLYIIIIPFSIAYIWGLNNFINIEKAKGNYVLFNNKSSDVIL